jgi:hypothetical protein
MDGSRRRSLLRDPAVLGCAVLAVLVRLAVLTRPLGPDEAGYLAVGRQWGSAGTSLYGDYWVDRPPLLVALFRLAALAGGTVPLRLLGCLAVVVCVLAVARAAGTVSGPVGGTAGGTRSARVGAAVAAALLVTPMTGALEVDGELLAAPFIAVSLAAALEALAAVPRRRAVAAAVVCGAAAVAAVLVKQNMVDGLVMVAALALGLRAGGHRRLARPVRRLVAGTVVGGLLAAGLVAVWTAAHGTSVPAVLWAMYPFRLEAGRAIAAHPSAGALGRIRGLLDSAVGSGLVPLVAVATVAVARRRRSWSGHPGRCTGPPPRVVTSALLVVAGYGAVSIALGGNSWLHYLLEPVAPVAVAVAVAVPALPRTTRLAAGLVVASAALALVGGLRSHGNAADRLGAQIGAVSRPGDSIVTGFGHAQVTSVSGLPSPYPYLWSLPAHVLDPHLRLLDRVLADRRAPTWFVLYSSPGPRSWTRRTQRELELHYHEVDDVSGHLVYLRDGLHRVAPVPAHG